MVDSNRSNRARGLLERVLNCVFPKKPFDFVGRVTEAEIKLVTEHIAKNFNLLPKVISAYQRGVQAKPLTEIGKTAFDALLGDLKRHRCTFLEQAFVKAAMSRVEPVLEAREIVRQNPTWAQFCTFAKLFLGKKAEALLKQYSTEEKQTIVSYLEKANRMKNIERPKGL